MDDAKQYWDERFIEETEIWGKDPSIASCIFLDFLMKNDMKESKILDIACGYGRDSRFFAQNGLKVQGIDFSEAAIAIATEQKNNNLSAEFIVGDIFDMPFNNDSYDVLFGNFILHLFTLDQRMKLLIECSRVIKNKGILAFCVASVDDSDFGQGEKMEENSFINKRGVTKHYYSIESIQNEFSMLVIRDIIPIEENHVHDFPHTHKSYLIIAEKRV